MPWHARPCSWRELYRRRPVPFAGCLESGPLCPTCAACPPADFPGGSREVFPSRKLRVRDSCRKSSRHHLLKMLQYGAGLSEVPLCRFTLPCSSSRSRPSATTSSRSDRNSAIWLTLTIRSPAPVVGPFPQSALSARARTISSSIVDCSCGELRWTCLSMISAAIASARAFRAA